MKKIIVVDDSIEILDSLEMMLELEGYNIEKYEKGSKMYNSLDISNKPDVILMDMWLSGEDGRDICKMIKTNQDFKNIPVIIMSASRALSSSALESGASEFIPKPFDLIEILEKINFYSKMKINTTYS